MADTETTDTAEAPEATFRGNRVVGWQTDGPVTAADAAARDRSTVTQPDPASLGPRTVFGDDTSAAGQANATAADAPQTVPEVIAYIREPADPDDARDRARAMWSAEVVRDGGIRSGVEDEVSRWLSDDEVGRILADADQG